MPTIIVDKAKGLFQKAGTTQNPAGSFSGAKSVVYPTVIDGVAAHTASLNDSGKSFIIGGAAAASGGGALALPEMLASNIGWNCQLILTGAQEGNIIVQTVDSTGASATSDAFLLGVSTPDGGATNKVSVSSNKITFVTTCASSAYPAIVDIKYIAANKAVVGGTVAT